MSRTQSVLLGLVLVLALLVTWIAFRNPEAPMLPADEQHRPFIDTDACMECHTRDAVVPQSDSHPVGRDCLRCHGSG